MSISALGTNTVGETYSLVCSATVTGSNDQLTISWSDPMNNPVPSEMVTTTGSMSTLTFNPLSTSHAGTYTCRGIAGSLSGEGTFTVQVNIPGLYLSDVFNSLLECGCVLLSPYTQRSQL